MKNKALTWLIVLVVFVALMVIASLLTGPEGARLSGVLWIIFTLIAAVIIYAIYFATAESKVWEVGTRQVVYMAIGAALYGVLTWWANAAALPSVSLVSLRPTVCLPIFFGFVFGPVVGFFTGAVGNILGDFLTGWGVYPVWDIANGFMGFVPGLILLFADKRRGLNVLTVAVAVLVVIAAAIVLIKPVIPHPWTGEETD
ncbi:MAG: hypothetical protein FJ014_05160, partial [Chloroflexi bacterium]|nr:hypothetical protein [Chloroflexota bacterium]